MRLSSASAFRTCTPSGRGHTTGTTGASTPVRVCAGSADTLRVERARDDAVLPEHDARVQDRGAACVPAVHDVDRGDGGRDRRAVPALPRAGDERWAGGQLDLFRRDV